MPHQPRADFRVAIVAEHASAQFGGEAALALHYYRVLKKRGVPTWLVVHERTRSELEALFPADPRILYVADTAAHIALWRIGVKMPARIAYFTVGYLQRVLVQRMQKKMVRKLIAQEGVQVVHQPMPVSPREPSMLHGFGVPVVIGPMNGNIDYPPAFRSRQSAPTIFLLALGRQLANAMHGLSPGKLRSAVLLVANERTRLALPPQSRARVIELVENGVDLSVWQTRAASDAPAVTRLPTFVFMGRLVDWKAVDLLIDAFLIARGRASMSLVIVGDGPERPGLEARCREAGALAEKDGEEGKIFFAGWQTQQACAVRLAQSASLVLSSLMECGGAVVLEAMAAARPVIATRWGGPADYLDTSCGILVEPTSRPSMISAFAEGMQRLATSPALQTAMGEAGRRRAEQHFDWEVKVDRMLEIYAQALQHHAAQPG